MMERDATSTPPVPAEQYTVVARRYRPQTFDELIGQEHVARGLTQAIASDRVGHAYLFTGARGVGKTSAARVLAKALNCVHGPTAEPCNKCDICQSISSGDDVDVLEIDGASNRGIDEIRQLRQNVAVRPSRARLKIYIIDEVHMLTKEAFNALLKTLEEPPEHVKFIFATTEPNKIPITILSRCQRFDFAGIDAQAIQARLTQIAEAEGVGIEPAAVQILAARAAGSMRDSQSLLEQLLAVADGTITAGDVNQLLGIAPAERLSQLVEYLAQRNAAAALAELDGALGAGVDPGQLLDQLIGYFRDVMALGAGCSEAQLLYALPSQVEAIAKLAADLGMHTVLAILQILDQAAARMRVSVYGRTLLEMAVVRICNLENLDDLARLVDELRSGPAAPASPMPRPSQAPSAPQPRMDSRRGSSDTRAALERTETAVDLNPSINGQLPPNHSRLAELSAEDCRRLWEKITAEVGGLAASYSAVTEGVQRGPAGELVVCFAPNGAFAHQQCQRSDTARQLTHIAEQLLGEGVSLRFELTAPAGEAPRENTTRPRLSKRQQSAEVVERAFVKRAFSLFEVQPGEFTYVSGDDR